MLLTDPDEIRAILESDAGWSAYALGDLAPSYFPRSRWYALPGDRRSLAMVLTGFVDPVLFLMGDERSARLLLAELQPLPRVFFLVRPEQYSVFQEWYRIEYSDPMLRMVHDGRPIGRALYAAERLGIADLPALERLYANGDVNGERPDFFYPEMLDGGVYFGVREGAELIAAAGTHLCEPSESVGAIGNVYTRRDQRGLGLATRTVGAVTAELLAMRLRHIVLGVKSANSAARTVYERLGFRPHCLYEEGVAVRKPPTSADAAVKI